MVRPSRDIDIGILRELKKRAATEGRPLQAIVNEYLDGTPAAPVGPAFTLRLEGWNGKLQPGVDPFDSDSLFDLVDEP